jgi:hypothetical protein
MKIKNLLFALILISFFTGCSQEEDKSKVQSTSVTPKDAAQNCSGGSISAGQYFMMNNVWGSGAGSQCIWYNNINSWGVNASHTSGTGIKSYPAVVYGCHWGGCSSNTGLPKRISSLGNVHTWWSQSSSGDAWDAAYDIWFDASSNPGNRAATYELMVWLQWKNTKPIAENYDASGNAIPFARNVVIRDADGTSHTWNIYRRGNVFSFLLASQSTWISFDAKPLMNYCVARGWMSSSNYLISVQAGWEIIRGGTYSTSSYGVAGI